MTVTTAMIIEALVGLLAIFGALYKGVQYVARNEVSPVEANHLDLRGDFNEFREETKAELREVQTNIIHLDSDHQIMQKQIGDLVEQMKIQHEDNSKINASISSLTNSLTALVNKLGADITLL